VISSGKRNKASNYLGQQAAAYRLLNVAEETMGNKQSGEPVKKARTNTLKIGQV
jgi:hypothetical protein